jgi:hypothetical protein
VRPFLDFVLVALAAGELGGTVHARKSSDLVPMEIVDGQFGLDDDLGGRPLLKPR